MEIKKESTTLATQSDVLGIIALQQANLGKNLSEAEKLKSGYVSLETTTEDLGKIIEKDGVVVVYKQDGQLGGYLFSITQEYAKTLKFLEPFLENLKKMEFKGKNLSEYKYCILAQIAVKEDLRGSGVSKKLYQKLKEELKKQGYELGVSEIAADNKTSLNVHLQKLGLEKLGSYDSNGRSWVVVVLDLN